MRPRTLLVLAIVVGALLALIYFAEDKVASTDERAAAAKRLVDAKPDEVVAPAIEWQGSRVGSERSAAAAARDGAQEETTSASPVPGAVTRPWQIVEPFAKRADDAAPPMAPAPTTQILMSVLPLEAPLHASHRGVAQGADAIDDHVDACARFHGQDARRRSAGDQDARHQSHAVRQGADDLRW